MYLDIFDPKAAPRAIGIDLGTTNSIVAVVTDERPQALVTCDGTALLPSVVYYADHGAVLVGRAANAHRSREPQRTIASVKRFMGRSMAEAAALPLSTVVLDKTSSGDSVVRLDVGGRVVTPVEVSAEILKSLKKSAEDQLTNVGGAVITVPAHFDDAQRQATRDAGRLAGLEVLRLLNEPTAAALAYGLGERTAGTFAVYDLGGGTFDITVLELIDGVFQVKSTGGDTQLGGDDIDRALARTLLERMGFGEGEGIDPAIVSLALETAKSIKHALSDVEKGEWTIPRRGGGEVTLAFSRGDLELVSRPFLERTERVSRRALRDAELSVSDLEGVILVGGSTKMPAVKKFVAEVFGREPLCSIDPELVVAYGAALQAAALTGEGEDVLLLDVLPLSLGIETMGGAVDKILPRNTTIPAGARATFTTYADNQTGFELHVVQGERELAKDCRSLGRFSLKGIPPMPAGLARLEVHFNVDENNILEVTATEQVTGQTQKIEVKPSYGLSEDDIEDMLIDALEHGEEDLEARRLLDAKVEAERVLLATRKSLADDAALLVEGEGERIERAVFELEAALARLAETGAGAVRAGQLQLLLDALAAATHEFAGRRMNHAIQQALSGRDVVAVLPTVESARGVDAHVAEHEQNRSRRNPS